MRVHYGQHLYYVPNLLDRIDGRTNIAVGDAVKVIKVAGCPAANVMQHCYVGDVNTGRFIGMVHCNSLHTKAEYAEWLRARIAEKEQQGEL